jgi:hypothetical protein
MAVLCGRCSKLGSHRKSTNLEGGSGVNDSQQRKQTETAGRCPFNVAATGEIPMQSDSVYRIIDVVGVSETSWEDAGR